MFSDTTCSDFIHTIVKYHPQYTADDDSLWYIQVPWNVHVGNHRFIQLDNGDEQYLIDQLVSHPDALANTTTLTDLILANTRKLVMTGPAILGDQFLYDIHQLFRFFSSSVWV